MAARWCAATLGRLLLLPDDDELVLLGGFRHDVNLGTSALAPMLDGSFVKNLMIARGLLAAFAAPAPPMWLAGSFADAVAVAFLPLPAATGPTGCRPTCSARHHAAN